MMETEELQPPSSIEAEQAVIGSLLINPSMLPSLNGLQSEAFYLKAHQLIYSAIQTLKEKTDIITVSQNLSDREILDHVGGRQYITDCALARATVANAPYYAEIIREKHIQRQTIKFANSLTKDVYESLAPTDIASQLTTFGKTVSEYSETSDLVSLDAVLNESIELIEEQGKSGLIPGITSGFPQLDKALSGFQEEELIILGADTGMGKTTVALQMAVAAALSGVTTLFFSFEMSMHQLAMKVLASRSRVYMSKMRDGSTNNYDIELLRAAQADLNTANLFIANVKREHSTPDGVRAAITQHHQKTGNKVKLAVIDYLQLMRGGRPRASRQDEVSDIAKDLKAIAQEEKLAMLALAQVSRENSKRQDKRPKPQDLRESGAIEQCANTILFIYRDEYHNKESCYRGEAELIIAKQRMGPPGMVKLYYDKDRNEYRDPEAIEAPPVVPQVDFNPPEPEPPLEDKSVTDNADEPKVYERGGRTFVVRHPSEPHDWRVWDENSATVNLQNLEKRFGDNALTEYCQQMGMAETPQKLKYMQLSFEVLEKVYMQREADRKQAEAAAPPVSDDWRSLMGLT